jgi:hypothetical protein
MIYSPSGAALSDVIVVGHVDEISQVNVLIDELKGSE